MTREDDGRTSEVIDESQAGGTEANHRRWRMARNTGVAVKTSLRGHAPRAISSEEISRVAFELFERRGCVHGHDLEDWLEAERIVWKRRGSGNGRS